MKFLIALPDKDYFVWQMLVQSANFHKFGYDKDLIYIIGSVDGELNQNLYKIINSRRLNAKFFVYKDERQGVKYPSTLRPHILSKFFKNNPEYENETFFYTDPDVIFTKYLNFDKFLKDDIWYLSDTRSYLDSKYVKSKSEKLFEEMCNIVGVNPRLVEKNDENTGGAQYIMKNINYEFWDKVYWDSENLYNHMNSTSNIYNPKHPIQSWTADMWAVFYNALYFGNKVKVDKDLDFSWATDNEKRWHETYIFHNAGVLGGDKNRFSKIDYQISPFNKDIPTYKDSATTFYVNEIKYCEKLYPELLF
jgi:hypothetical protein